MGLLKFRRRTAAPSNVEFKEFDGKRQPVFTDTKGGQWRVRATDQGTNALHPMGDQDYEPEFEPALPSNVHGMPAKLPQPKAEPGPRTLPESANEYFGGFPLSEIVRARETARRGSPLNAYATTADTAELQEQNLMPEKRYHYCTADEPARLLALRDSIVQRIADHESGKAPLVPDDWSPSNEARKDRAKNMLGVLESNIEQINRMYANHRVVNRDNRTFTNTQVVQPGHIVTLGSTAPDGTESTSKFYLLSHPNELIEKENPGITQVHPHSYLGRSLLMKTRGESVRPVEQHKANDPTAWSEYNQQQNIYNLETKVLYRDLNPEEREIATRSMNPVQNIDFGTVKSISLPSMAALSGASNEKFNSSRYPSLSNVYDE
jgi:hypothetical protein